VEEVAYCRNCSGFREPGKKRFCSESCKEEWSAKRSHGIPAKMTILRRLLESEKIYPATDPLMHSEGFYTALQEWPCIWCGSEEKGTGINLDRIDNLKPHYSSNVSPVCSNLCNKIRSDVLSFEEMKILRPALSEIRIRRGNTRKN
jgi:hypothetical protein